jgi:hypothetical protein
LVQRGVGVVGIGEDAMRVVVGCGREGGRTHSSAVAEMGVMGVAELDLLVMVGHRQERCHYRSARRGDLVGAAAVVRYNLLLLVEGHWKPGRGVERRRQGLPVGVVRVGAFGFGR